MNNYEKYIRRSEKLDYVSLEGLPGIKIRNSEGVVDNEIIVTVLPICAPMVMIKTPHTHDFDQMLTVIGSDPDNILDLGGEVELTICEVGGEPQKLVFTTAASISVPKGLIHGPLVFTKINDPNKPMLFQDIIMTSEYIRKELK